MTEGSTSPSPNKACGEAFVNAGSNSERGDLKMRVKSRSKELFKESHNHDESAMAEAPMPMQQQTEEKEEVSVQQQEQHQEQHPAHSSPDLVAQDLVMTDDDSTMDMSGGSSSAEARAGGAGDTLHTPPNPEMSLYKTLALSGSQNDATNDNQADEDSTEDACSTVEATTEQPPLDHGPKIETTAASSDTFLSPDLRPTAVADTSANDKENSLNQPAAKPSTTSTPRPEPLAASKFSINDKADSGEIPISPLSSSSSSASSSASPVSDKKSSKKKRKKDKKKKAKKEEKKKKKKRKHKHKKRTFEDSKSFKENQVVFNVVSKD